MKVGAGMRLAFVFAAASLAGGAQAAVYEVMPDQSRLLILVYRAGPLGAMGHNHVVSAKRVVGEVHFQPDAVQDTQIRLRIPVQAFEVDDPQVRAAAGKAFAGTLDEDAIRGTRRNMLGPRVLHAERHPVVEVQSLAVQGALPDVRIRTRIRLRGESAEVEVPVRVEQQQRGLRAQGSVRLAQSTFGIEPFKIMLGAVAVRDEVEIHFDLRAQRAAP